jgi:hypothetical protein
MIEGKAVPEEKSPRERLFSSRAQTFLKAT